MLLVLTALGTEAVYVFLQRMPGTRWQQAVSAVLALAVVLSQIYSFLLIRDWADDRLVIYREVGTWLQQNTAPEASVGTLEVGIIGFYSERRMIGFAGLIQPEVAQIFSPARGYDYSAWWAFHQFQPTYLVLQENVFPRLEQDPSFLAMCHRLRVFDDPAYTYSLVVYECAYDEDA
jgi:hypothetical protein